MGSLGRHTGARTVTAARNRRRSNGEYRTEAEQTGRNARNRPQLPSRYFPNARVTPSDNSSVACAPFGPCLCQRVGRSAKRRLPPPKPERYSDSTGRSISTSVAILRETTVHIFQVINQHQSSDRWGLGSLTSTQASGPFVGRLSTLYSILQAENLRV